MTTNLGDFLDKKSLYYDKIDYTIISKSWNILKSKINLPYVIHIVGTNGKGTTGRFLASFLNQLNKKVLHYTSPHILEFNERIWINGKDSTNIELNNAHHQLQIILPIKYIEQLTYFEYTTLLALYLSSNMDYIILEAGLGGEFDATNVVQSDLSLFTTIGLDHQDFLGNTIEDIASTKMRSCTNPFILGKQKEKKIDKIKDDILSLYQEIEFKEDLEKPIGYDNLPLYLIDNLNLALSTLEYLRLSIDNLVIDKLSGRFEYISKNIICDVGHNPLAAKVIYDELVVKYPTEKIVLIYNSYANKDYKAVLSILKPIVKYIEIIECTDNRIVDKNILQDTIISLNMKYKDFDSKCISQNNRYLVFGSFLVVEEFLKLYNND